MPQRKFSLINARNIQTTPNVAFKQGKIQSNPGIYPNPLIGWRKQIESCDCSSNVRWYQVFKNTCCKPPIRRIQNRNGIMSRSALIIKMLLILTLAIIIRVIHLCILYVAARSAIGQTLIIYHHR